MPTQIEKKRGTETEQNAVRKNGRKKQTRQAKVGGKDSALRRTNCREKWNTNSKGRNSQRGNTSKIQ